MILTSHHFFCNVKLMEEMLDNGYPLTTERNTLRDIVMPPSVVNKIMAVTGMSGLTTSRSTPFTSPIPWRKQGVKHNTNEIYFDLEEKLVAIVNKSANTLTSHPMDL